MACLASKPSATFLHSLMDDDRLLLHYEEYRRSCLEEVGYVAALHRLVFQRLAATISPDASADDLRPDITLSVNTSVSYIVEHAFTQCEQLPWSLLVKGDLTENLYNLQAGEEPDEDVSSRIWKLLRRSTVSVYGIKCAILLWFEIRFTAIRIEQDHSGCSIVHRYHHEYGVNMLACRAFIYLFRILMRDAPRDAFVRMHEKKLASLENKNPNMLRGHNLYLRDVIDKCENLHAMERLAEFLELSERPSEPRPRGEPRGTGLL